MMRKEEREIRAFLRAMRLPEPKPERKAEDIQKMKEELSGKRLYGRMPLPVRIGEQAASISPVSWLMQLAVVFSGITLAGMTARTETIRFIALVIPLIGIIGSYELSKGFFYNMWELEQTCRYDCRRIAGIKLFLFGLCDLVIISIFSLLVYREGGGLFEISMYILLPFCLSTGVYLLVMESAFYRNHNMVLFVAGLFMAGLEMMFQNYMFISGSSLREGWAGVLMTGGLAFMVYGIIRYCRMSGREEKGLWNLS